MARLFLRLASILAILGCVVSAYRFLGSVVAIIDSWKTLRDDMIVMPFFWCYAFVMNAALFVVFSKEVGTNNQSQR
jgi:hypothetical protein